MTATDENCMTGIQYVLLNLFNYTDGQKWHTSASLRQVLIFHQFLPPLQLWCGWRQQDLVPECAGDPSAQAGCL